MSPYNPFNIARKLWRIVPALLSSGPHVLFLLGLGAFLVALPLLHLITPSANAELIGGNYTNVASAVGAAIAAGTSRQIARNQAHHSWDISDLRDSLIHLHHKHNRLADKLDAACPLEVVTSAGLPVVSAVPPAAAPAAAPATVTTEVTTTVTEP